MGSKGRMVRFYPQSGHPKRCKIRGKISGVKRCKIKVSGVTSGNVKLGVSGVTGGKNGDFRA